MNERYDVVVIGGGAAGLSGALTLARARRSVLVIDAGEPRNAPASQVHVYLGREGLSPRRLVETGREEVQGYGGEIAAGTVSDVQRAPDGSFVVSLADGQSVRAARLLVATGLADVLPDLPGLASLWGKDVLHCPYCHGWEVRDQAIGILATSPLAVHQALLWRQWSSDVTLFLHNAPAPSEEEWEQLAARGISVVEGEVAGLVVTGGRLTGVRLTSGKVIRRQALAVGTRMVARTDFLAGIGLEAAEFSMAGHVVGTHIPTVDPMGRTAVAGVWVAGNATNLAEQVIGSAAAGVKAGAGINADLIAEETAAAVAARRTSAPALARSSVGAPTVD